MSLDPYLDLATGVLRNRLGLTDARQLARAEADLTGTRFLELQERPLPGDYDLTHLRALHRYIFGDVYDWAGELRTVTIGKGGGMFTRPEPLEAEAEELFAWLARTNHLRGLDRSAFLDELTELMSDLNALHPFREGNGRTQRAFVGQLARAAGHPIHWKLLDRDENIAASKAAHQHALDPLRALLDNLVARPEAGEDTVGT